MKRIIYYNQVGFILGMQDQFNIWKSVNVIYQQGEKEKSHDHTFRCRKLIWQNPTPIHTQNK